jgi:hypothetical protein
LSPLIAYREIGLSEKRRRMVQLANAIIQEYENQGYTLTLRQLYYQFVARDLIPNTQAEYKRLGSLVNDARLAGLIDWSAIEDRTRHLEARARWEDPQQILEAVANQYHRDRWVGQAFRPELWVEKEALVGVFERVCHELDIPYFACRGYVSQSEQWRAGRRFRRIAANGQTPVVLHFGDHDPSGIDMTRDQRERLGLFAEEGVEVRRLALNMDQVEQYQPPPNPAKVTDSRFETYVAEHGGESWELDALEPQVLVALVRDAAAGLIDPAVWADVEEREAEERAALQQVQARWDDVRAFLGEE